MMISVLLFFIMCFAKAHHFILAGLCNPKPSPHECRADNIGYFFDCLEAPPFYQCIREAKNNNCLEAPSFYQCIRRGVWEQVKRDHEG
jgi:hypothetical protein